MDSNGYIPSILQADTDVCYLCGRSHEKLDRHEVYGGALRQKSKRLGLWVTLCHSTCHLNGVHRHGDIALWLKEKAQKEAMEYYGWTVEDFRKEFYKSYI